MASPSGYHGFVQLNYLPKKTDLICEFKIEPASGLSIRDCAERIAGESSVGTWTEVSTTNARIKAMGARVFEIKGNCIRVAYPFELFERGNMPQIFSSIAGNIFNMKDVKNLRLESIRWPKEMIDSFHGPQFGIAGIRKLMNVHTRPFCGTIVKPKLGLDWKEHAKVAYDAWVGGLDFVKDDENLTSQPFNNFYERIEYTLKMRDKAEIETGEKKMYFANVTAEANEMVKRARFVKECGGEYVMVDVLTAGFSGLQTLRNETEDLKLAIHAHRAMHGAITRNPKHGIAMLALAETMRMIGVDQLHIGTAVGKMLERKPEVMEIREEIENSLIKNKKHVLAQDWNGVKPILAVCSGGLHAGMVQKLASFMGKDIVVQAGGGVHGLAGGTRAGARALRDAVEAVGKNIPMQTYAKTHKELDLALKTWGLLR